MALPPPQMTAHPTCRSPLLLGLACLALGCAGPSGSSTTPSTNADGVPLAHVEAVEVSGEAGAYSFGVQVRSEETGCDQYADWWEVLTPSGELLYRRILAHSHPDEQPFTRSGGPVAVGSSDELLVRAHLHPTGFGGQALGGTVTGGFEPIELADDFAAELATAEPQPEGCAW